MCMHFTLWIPSHVPYALMLHASCIRRVIALVFRLHCKTCPTWWLPQ